MYVSIYIYVYISTTWFWMCFRELYSSQFPTILIVDKMYLVTFIYPYVLKSMPNLLDFNWILL